MRDRLSPEAIRKILGNYYAPIPIGIDLNIQKYLDLLDKWGRKMSLTSIRDPEEMVRFHFGESIFALSLTKMSNGRLADVGTGAGFPGLPLKLARPELSVILIEPNRRKCAFLHEIVRSLELSDVRIVSAGFGASNIRTQSLNYVTCRAIAECDAILGWARETVAVNGEILLWMGESEVGRMQGNDNWSWQKPARIPETRARFVLKGSRKM